MRAKNSIAVILVILVALFPNQVGAQLNKAYFYNQARLFISQNQNLDAISALNQLIAADSTLMEVWFLRGVAKYGLNDLRGSIADFDRAIRLNPVYTQAYLYRGSAQGQLGALSNSINDYNQVLDLRPNHAEALVNRGISYMAAQRFKEALKDFERVVQLEPKNSEVWKFKGTAHLFLSDTAASLQSFSHSIRLNPLQSDSYSQRGRLMFEMKRHPEALHDLNSAIGLDSTSWGNLMLRGLVYEALGNSLAALADLNKSLMLNADNPLGYFNRALILWKVGRLAEAMDDFSHSGNLNPNNVLVFYNKSVLSLEMNRLENSLRDINRALELLPEFTRAYLVRSQINLQMGRLANSQRDHERAMQLAQKYSENPSQWSDTSERFRKLVTFQNELISSGRSRLSAGPVGLQPMFRVVAERNGPIPWASQPLAVETLNDNEMPFHFILSTAGALHAIAKPTHGHISPLSISLLDIQNGGLSRRYSETVGKLRELLSKNPENPLVKINLATELTEMALFVAQFEQDFKPQSIDLFDTSPMGRNISQPSLHPLSVEEPLNIMIQLADEYPNWEHIKYNVGYIMALSGQWQQAIEWFDHCIALNASLSEAYFNKGYVLLTQNKTDEGCSVLGRAGELGMQKAFMLIGKHCQ